MSWLWWAPLGAAALHVGEEFVHPGGFASWDREYRPAIRNSITPKLHLVVNALLLAACASVGLAGMPAAAKVAGGLRRRSVIPPSLSVPAWLALTALLFSNAVFHVIGTYKTKRVRAKPLSSQPASRQSLEGRIISGPPRRIAGGPGPRKDPFTNKG